MRKKYTLGDLRPDPLDPLICCYSFYPLDPPETKHAGLKLPALAKILGQYFR